jgi:small subunit ribosomal protein S13
VDTALTYIFGIGRHRASKIVVEAEVKAETRVRDLTEEEVSRLRDVIEKNYKVEGYLRREIAQNIKRLIEISCYRGIRHRRGLPVRGQRTRTNSRTRKGPKRGVGIRKK